MNSRFDNNDIKLKCESSFNELKFELNEKLSHSLNSMNNRIDEIESNVVEKIDKQIQEVTENFERKIDECNVSSEYTLNCVCLLYTSHCYHLLPYSLIPHF